MNRKPATDGDLPAVSILDPDQAVRDSLAFLLAKLPCRVQAYGEAAAFLGELSVNGEPACLILEWGLPCAGGAALMAELASRGYKFPVLVIASQSDVPTAVNAMQAGALDFIEKPFVGRVLAERIRSLLQAGSPAA